MEATVGQLSPDDGRALHRLKNHLSIVLGFSELLLNEMPPSDSRHADLREIHAAAEAAMRALSEIAGDQSHDAR
jgi:hypothetical protein